MKTTSEPPTKTYVGLLYVKLDSLRGKAGMWSRWVRRGKEEWGWRLVRSRKKRAEAGGGERAQFDAWR